MSSLYIAFGVVATFAAVVAAALTLRVSAQSRRPVEVLETELRHAGVSIRQHTLQRPFVERVMDPLVSALARMAGHLAPAGARDRITMKLVLAGSPPSWTPERVLAFKGLGLIAGAALGYFVGVVGGPNILGIFWTPLLAFTLFMIPGAALGQAVTRRQEAIRRALPDTMDLLTISVEAGLGFDGALLHVRRHTTGPLAQEIGWMLHEMQLGVSRVDAFRHLSERTNVDELKGFVLAMIQADVFGVSVASVLRAQSRELRTQRRQRAEEKAIKVPVKLLFPMLLCIMPALFVVLIAPGVLKIAETLFGPSGVFSSGGSGIP
jgi:tight adherence protein C